MSDTTHSIDLISVRDYLRFAVSRFCEAGLVYGHGTATALDDAAFLILETLRLPPDSLEPWLDARLTRTERARLLDVIQERVVTRRPSSYLTGSAYIGPHRFSIDDRVIVPRSFIGELLCADDGTGDVFGLTAAPERVLDLCTGSGCLAIVAAHTFADASVVATDVSADALAVAADNVRAHQLSERVTLKQSDLFAALSGEVFDLIVCNPPYVTAAAVAAFPPEYSAEPELAHLGGPDGMALVRRVLDHASRHLAADGTVVMEIGHGRATLERDYPRVPFVWLDTASSSGEIFTLPASALRPARSAATAAKRGRSRT